jgi:hypothetical protein
VQSFFLKTKFVEKLRRNRPLNSLKGKCREVVVGSLREVSQVGERANESHGKKLLPFVESSKGKRTDEIFGEDFTKFQGTLYL